MLLLIKFHQVIEIIIIICLFYLKDILISISNFVSIYFRDVLFNEINISSQILNAEYGKNLFFFNVSCENVNDDINSASSTRGGCFRTKNILSREIINMKISNITSKNTSAGFKAIDDKNELANLNNKFNFMEKNQVNFNSLILCEKFFIYKFYSDYFGQL